MNKSLLSKLACLLIQLSSECINDSEFNERIAELNIFSRSLDEIVADLQAYLDN